MRRLLLLFWFVLFTTLSNSQDLFTKELIWTPTDSIKVTTFQDQDQIIEWSYNQLPFSSVYSKNIHVNDSKIYISIVTGCSGLPCWRIFIFKEKDELWQLITSTDARLTEKIEIEVDNNSGKIVFNTKSRKIGELPFEILNF